MIYMTKDRGYCSFGFRLEERERIGEQHSSAIFRAVAHNCRLSSDSSASSGRRNRHQPIRRLQRRARRYLNKESWLARRDCASLVPWDSVYFVLRELINYKACDNFADYSTETINNVRNASLPVSVKTLKTLFDPVILEDPVHACGDSDPFAEFRTALTDRETILLYSIHGYFQFSEALLKFYFKIFLRLMQTNLNQVKKIPPGVSPDRRMNKVMRPMAMLILHEAEEHTTCIEVDLKQGFQQLIVNSPFMFTSFFSEALLRFYFQDIPPPYTNKDILSLENSTKGECNAFERTEQHTLFRPGCVAVTSSDGGRSSPEDGGTLQDPSKVTDLHLPARDCSRDFAITPALNGIGMCVSLYVTDTTVAVVERACYYEVYLLVVLAINGWEFMVTVHDKVSTFEINLRKKSLLQPACILTDALSDMRPVKLVTVDGNSTAMLIIHAAVICRASTRRLAGRSADHDGIRNEALSSGFGVCRRRTSRRLPPEDGLQEGVPLPPTRDSCTAAFDCIQNLAGRDTKQGFRDCTFCLENGHTPRGWPDWSSEWCEGVRCWVILMTGRCTEHFNSRRRPYLEAVHDKVSTFEIILTMKSLLLPAYILTCVLSDVRPVKLRRGRGGIVVRLLTFYQGEPCSVPGGVRSRVFARGNRAVQYRWSEGFLGDLAFPPLRYTHLSLTESGDISAALNIEAWRADKGEVRRVWGSSPRKPADQRHLVWTRFLHAKIRNLPLQESNRGSPRWKASSLTTTPPWHLVACGLVICSILPVIINVAAGLTHLFMCRPSEATQSLEMCVCIVEVEIRTLMCVKQEQPMRMIEVSMEQRRKERVGKREIPEKTRGPTASSGTIPTCENSDAWGLQAGSLFLRESGFWAIVRISAIDGSDQREQNSRPRASVQRRVRLAGWAQGDLLDCLSQSPPRVNNIAAKNCAHRGKACGTRLLHFFPTASRFSPRVVRWTRVLAQPTHAHTRRCGRMLEGREIPEKTPADSGIVGHDSNMRKCGGDPAGNRTRLAYVGGERAATTITRYNKRHRRYGQGSELTCSVLAVLRCLWDFQRVAGIKGRGKREMPENTRRPATPSGTIPTCENPVIRPGIEPGSPWWVASVLVAQLPWPPRDIGEEDGRRREIARRRRPRCLWCERTRGRDIRRVKATVREDARGTLEHCGIKRPSVGKVLFIIPEYNAGGWPGTVGTYGRFLPIHLDSPRCRMKMTAHLLPECAGVDRSLVRNLGHPVGSQLDCGGEEKLTPYPLLIHQTYFKLQGNILVQDSQGSAWELLP
ncbi:hypothetical protein PR048_030494 [Dryococelus australis]|uniref:Uncharacterized protein n=1 Tax=Dryococelus australis TaxID=614101 RepID=A0ABQ9G9L4_9NEOP|nr:hypothetical protein PR048_030494 [Dryococelus australis]